jgi:hypothetical protein
MFPSGRLVIGIIVFKINLKRCLDNWIIAMIDVNPEDNAGSFDATDILIYHEKSLGRIQTSRMERISLFA